MVSLLASQQMNVVVLLDGEESDRATAHEDLVKTRLIREKDVLFIPVAFAASEEPEKADIEDLLDAEVFDALVRESYADELEGKDLELNEQVPRIVKRYDLAFEKLGIEFHKTRPARLFLDKMGSDPESVLSDDSKSRFTRLFETECGAGSEPADGRRRASVEATPTRLDPIPRSRSGEELPSRASVLGLMLSERSDGRCAGPSGSGPLHGYANPQGRLGFDRTGCRSDRSRLAETFGSGSNAPGS